MIINPKSTMGAFQAFDVTFRIESPEDAAKLHFLFNYGPITSGLELNGFASAAREAISSGAPQAREQFGTLREQLVASLKRMAAV